MVLYGLCVGYCLVMIVASSYYVAGDNFSGQSDPHCWAIEGSKTPVLSRTPDSVDFAERMRLILNFGLGVHIFGFFADAALFASVSVKRKVFKISAFVLVAIYTLFFIVWVIYLLVVRFSEEARVCSGKYLELSSGGALPDYSIVEGAALITLILICLFSNVAVGVIFTAFSFIYGSAVNKRKMRIISEFASADITKQNV